MKFGVISEGDKPESLVAEDFGHAPYFLIVDPETLDYTVVENEYANGEGAGYKVAKAIVGIGVDVVIVGGIGTHGLKILQDAGIRVFYDMDDTVEKCVTEVRDHIALEKKFDGKN